MPSTCDWAARLVMLRNQQASRNRDLDLSSMVDEDFCVEDQENVIQLLLSFVSNIDSSVLQSFENALARVDFRMYFRCLGLCFSELAKVNVRVAIERLNYPGRSLREDEIKAAFREFISGSIDEDQVQAMRTGIVEWRLLGDEPFRTFLELSNEARGSSNG